MVEANIQKTIRATIKTGDKAEFLRLIREDLSRLAITNVFGTWLHQAASYGRMEIVKELVAMGVDVNAQGGVSGGNALNEAASDGQLQIVRFLHKHGAQLDTREPTWNPLFGAILNGHTEIVKFLIEQGIDTTVSYTGENMKNMDAIAFAKEWGRTEIVKLIKDAQKKRADLN